MSSLANAIFSVDWLTLTVHAPLEKVKPFIRLLGLDAGLEAAPYGTKGFQTLHVGLNGFRVGSEPGAGREYCTLWLPGSALRAVGVDRLERFYTALCSSRLRFNCSRLDLAFDTQRFTVRQVVEAFSAGLVRCSAKTVREIKGLAGDDGHTLYFGSRSSMAMMRFYRKVDAASSFGSDAFTRCELELKGDRALLALLEIMAAGRANWAAQAARLVVGFISIASEWWETWASGLAASWLRLRRNVPTVASIEAWLVKQVAPNLAVWAAAKSGGGDAKMLQSALRDLVGQGRERWQKHHEALVQNYNPKPSESIAVFAL